MKNSYANSELVSKPDPNTVKCLSIVTPKSNTFPFVPNGKFIIFRCPKIWAHYNLTIMCLNIGTPNNHHFPFGTNGKVVVLGVPVLKHFRVQHQIHGWISSLQSLDVY